MPPSALARAARRGRSRPVKQRRSVTRPLGEVTALLPEPPQRGTDAQGQLDGTIVRGSLHRAPQVVVLGIQAVEPLARTDTKELGFGLVRKGNELVVVAVPEGARSSLSASRSRAYSRIVSSIAKRGSPSGDLESGAAGSCRRATPGHRACPRRARRPGRRRRSRIDGAAADEDGEAPEEHPLGAVQQVVAPVDGTAQRALPLRQVARGAGQERQALLEAREDGIGSKSLSVPRPARWPAAGRPGGCRWPRRPARSARRSGTRAARPAPAGRRAPSRRTWRATREAAGPEVRDAQRRNGVLLLAAEVQHFAAGDQDRSRGARSSSRLTRGAPSRSCSKLSRTSSSWRSRRCASSSWTTGCWRLRGGRRPARWWWG